MSTVWIISVATHLLAYFLYFVWLFRKTHTCCSVAWIIFSGDLLILMYFETQQVPLSLKNMQYYLHYLISTVGAIVVVIVLLYKTRKISFSVGTCDRLVVAIACITTFGYLILSHIDTSTSRVWWYAVLCLGLGNVAGVIGFFPLITKTFNSVDPEPSTPWFIWGVSYCFFLAVRAEEGSAGWGLLFSPAVNIVLSLLLGVLSLRALTDPSQKKNNRSLN